MTHQVLLLAEHFVNEVNYILRAGFFHNVLAVKLPRNTGRPAGCQSGSEQTLAMLLFPRYATWTSGRNIANAHQLFPPATARETRLSGLLDAQWPLEF